MTDKKNKGAGTTGFLSQKPPPKTPEKTETPITRGHERITPPPKKK